MKKTTAEMVEEFNNLLGNVEQTFVLPHPETVTFAPVKKFGTKAFANKRLAMLISVLEQQREMNGATITFTIGKPGVQIKRKKISVKRRLRDLFAGNSCYVSKDVLISLFPGITWQTLKVAISELKNPAYCGNGQQPLVINYNRKTNTFWSEP